MRKHQQRSVLSGIIASKRIAVALCAAIAMVLGAMSVGATFHLDNSPEPQSSSGQSSVSALVEGGTSVPIDRQTQPALPTTLATQPTLTPGNLQAAPPILVKPLKSKVDLNLGPVKASANEKGLELTIDITAPLHIPIGLDPIGITEEPKGETGTAEPTTEPDTSEPASTDAQEPPADSQTLQASDTTAPLEQ